MSLKRIERPVVVLVEGREYIHFLGNILKSHRDIRDEIFFIDFTSVSNSPRELLRVIKKVTGFENVRALGIIRDAEYEPLAMHQQIQDSLRDASFSVPEAPNVLCSGMPRIGYLLVPESGQGCLETVCAEVAVDKSVLAFASNYVEACCIRSDRNVNWKLKATVHSIIATSNKPEAPLGLSVELGIWDVQHPSIQRIIMFLRMLATVQ